MNFQCSKIQGKKIKVGDDDTNHDLDAVSRDFLNEAHEDILLEIFIRLHDCGCAVRSGIVCHSWHSLISQPQFIPRFISHHHQHQDCYSLPYTIIFHQAAKFGVSADQYCPPICKLFSEESMSANLDFLPSRMVIRASCNDLLLVSPSACWLTDHYICNPITKRLYQLPEIPVRYRCASTGYALVCMPRPTNQFKVVNFHYLRFPNPESEEPNMMKQPVTIFCSKSRKWKRRRFRYPRPKKSYLVSSLDVVTCNGILYWLEHEGGVERVIYLDLSKRQCGVIDFPGDCYYDTRVVREQIGAVRLRGVEELRLLQVVFTGSMESIVHLKVWKLNYYTNEDKDWVLVHHKKKLKRPENSEEQHFVALFLHPTNGDVVFMVWGRNVFQYNLISTTTYEMIGELQGPLLLRTGCNPTKDRLLSFPMVHPTWPTLLPNPTR